MNITNNKNTKSLFLAFCVIFTFMVIEIIGGIFSGSLALLADAGHMLTDAIALLFSLLTVSLVYKTPTSHHTFGWLRLTTLTAFVNSIVLVVMTLLICWEAIQRFRYPQPVSCITMIIIAGIGLIANLIVFWILRNGENSEKNFNMQAAILHIISDLLSSVGSITAALIIYYTSWMPADPILSLLVSCLVLRSTWVLLKNSANELLEGAPMSLDILALKCSLCSEITEIKNVHHVHIWQVGEKLIMTLHVQVTPPHDHDALLNCIKLFLERQHKISHTTIQMEYQPCSGFDCYINKIQSGYSRSHCHY